MIQPGVLCFPYKLCQNFVEFLCFQWNRILCTDPLLPSRYSHVWCYVTTQNVKVVVEGFWYYTRSFNVPCHCRPSLNTGTSAIFMVMFRSRTEPVCGTLGFELTTEKWLLKIDDGHFHCMMSPWRLLTFESPSTEILLILGYFLFPF